MELFWTLKFYLIALLEISEAGIENHNELHFELDFAPKITGISFQNDFGNFQKFPFYFNFRICTENSPSHIYER